MSEPAVFLTKSGPVAHLVLNRPGKRNALSQQIWGAIPGLVEQVASDASLKVLVVRGADPLAFSAGADISEFEQVNATEESALAYERLIHRAYDALAGLERPTIARISGVCYGGGCALALMCDLRYADQTARFSIPPARLGLAYSLKETRRLSDLVGPSKAKEMLMGARVIGPREALEIGLVTRMFASAELERETDAFAAELCQLSQYTIRAVKAVCAEIAGGAFEDNERTEALVLGAFRSPDYAEGRDAFLEKRTARFTFG